LTGVNLGGLTLLPGVYKFSSTAQLTGALILNANNNPNAQFVFQIGSTLTTAAGASVTVINNVASPSCIVFWQVGSSATLGAANAFEGHILALASITVGAGTSIVSGSALAHTGAVTLDTDHIVGCAGSVVPVRSTTWGAVKSYYR
jgi:type VI secretion system secreted protein VgrG